MLSEKGTENKDKFFLGSNYRFVLITNDQF